jgi:hypothetical protein
MDDNSALNNQFTVPLSLYKYRQQSKQTHSVSNAQVVLKSFGKGFDVTKRDSRFGISLGADAAAEFGTRSSSASVSGGVSVRILGKDITFLDVDTSAKLQYDSFEETGYDVSVKAIGRNVLHSSKNITQLADYTVVPKAELEEEEKKLSQAEQKKILTLRQAEMDAEEKNALEYTKDFTITKELEKSQTIMVSIVPVTVTAGAVGELGMQGIIKLEGILLLHSEMGPQASLTGFASGGVGAEGFSAGIEASFRFIDNYFRGTTDFELFFSGTGKNLRLKGVLTEKVLNTFEGPLGSIDLYAEYSKPKICEKKTCFCYKWNWKGKCKKEVYTCEISLWYYQSKTNT